MGNALEGGRHHGLFKDVDVDAYLNKEHTGKFIGREGNAGYAYWNPETDSYVRQTYDDYKNTSLGYRDDNNNDNMLSAYYNKFGNFVSGVRPENTYMTYVGGIPTLHSGKDPIDPNPEWLPDPTNKTGVPLSIRNPDYDPTFVNTQSRFKDAPTGGFGISYNSNGLLTPKAAWENKIANFNPDERAAWESNVEGMLANTLNSSQPVTPGQDVVPLTPGQQAAWNTPEAGAALEAKWDGTVDGLNVATAVIQNTQNSDDIPVFVEQAYGLMTSDPEAFDTWAESNPLWAGRYYAYLADATQERQSQIDGHDPLYNTHTTGLPFSLATLLGDQVTDREDLEHEYVPEGSGFDEDYYRTKANDLLGYGHDFSGREFKDINNRNGADFFKLGGNNTSRHGSVLDFVKKNPLEVGAMAAVVTFAPQLVAQMGFSSPAVASAVTSGLTSLGSSTVTGNLDGEAILSAIVTAAGGYIKGGVPTIPGFTAEDTSVLMNFVDSVGEAESAGSFIDSALAAGDITRETYNMITGNLPEGEKSSQGNSSNSELQRPTGPESTWDRPWIGNTPVDDVEGRDWVYGPTDRQEDPHWHTVPKTGEEAGGGGSSGGGGAEGGSGGPASSTSGGAPDGEGFPDNPANGDTWSGNELPPPTNEGRWHQTNTLDRQVWEAWDRETDPALKDRIREQYEKQTGGSVDDGMPEGEYEFKEHVEHAPDVAPEQTPTPNEDLPEGYEWVLNEAGEWILNTPDGEHTEQEFKDAIWNAAHTSIGDSTDDLGNSINTGDVGTGTEGTGTDGTGTDGTDGTGTDGTGGTGTDGTGTDGTGADGTGNDGSGEGDDGDGIGDGNSFGDGGNGTMQFLTGQGGGADEGLFDLTKLSPSATAVLGPYINHITGARYN